MTRAPHYTRSPSRVESAGCTRSRVDSAALLLSSTPDRMCVATRRYSTHTYLLRTWWVGVRAARENRGQWMEKGEGNRGEIEAYRRHRASADFQPHHPRDTITPSFLSTSSSSSSSLSSTSSSSSSSSPPPPPPPPP